MNTRNLLSPLAVVVVFAFCCLVLSERAVAGSDRDHEAIMAAAKKYLASQEYASDIGVKVEKVDGDYARVVTVPKNDMDPALVFMKRENGVWKGLTIGTGFDPEDLAKLHIPTSLRP